MIRADGNIIIGDKDFIIDGNLTEDVFRKSDLYNGVLSHDTYAYSTYRLAPQHMGKEKFSISIIFNPNNKIDLVSLTLNVNGELPSWDNWSEQRELERKVLHDKCLLKWLGKPPYHYEWGSVSSHYDPRSGSSAITVCYK